MLERAVNEIFEVLRASSATAVFLGGAAVLITQRALTIPTPEELQTVVATNSPMSITGIALRSHDGIKITIRFKDGAAL